MITFDFIAHIHQHYSYVYITLFNKIYVTMSLLANVVSAIPSACTGLSG